MVRNVSILIFCLLASSAYSQHAIVLSQHWKFKKATETTWLPASVPGTVHTDLLANKLIPDPYYRDNERSLQWISKEDWDYQDVFDINNDILSAKKIDLIFEGLDTYCSVYLNNHLIIQTDNMFREWRAEVTKLVRKSGNKLWIRFYSAERMADSISGSRSPVIPDNPRVLARKAQYNFGWDFAPRFITCGIWKPVRLEADGEITPDQQAPVHPVKLIQNKDSIGRSFYFEKAGIPVYIKGANWVPADVFLPSVTPDRYRNILIAAKDAGINMLRVWGGGIYESDTFYDVCDSLGIMVWQDFMFAGGMIPHDNHFFDNVREEVKYQLKRLGKHSCIVLWCGNNEIDEAWHNWDWQQQFNIHGKDSSLMWNDYKKLFEDSLPSWVKNYDGRPYIPGSPKFGWGREQSLKEGDSHYWGLWWGLEDVEIFKKKTGRFVSEYGMQAMPGMGTIQKFTDTSDRYLFSAVLQAHQKHPTGFSNLQYYLNRYFLDSNKVKKLSLENYSYLTQCLQYYVLKKSISIHMSQYPQNMGTMFWQLDEPWPGINWSIIDYYGLPKAGWYAVKEAYNNAPSIESEPKSLQLAQPFFSVAIDDNKILLTSTEFAKFVYLSFNGKDEYFSDNYFDIPAGVTKTITLKRPLNASEIGSLHIKSLYEVLQ